MTTPGLRDADERNLIAEEIRALRDQRGWSQQELAERIQFSLSTVKHLETGYRAPTEEHVTELVRGYPGLTEPDMRERIAARLRRQDVLDGESPPWMWVVLDEQVLRRPVGGPTVMAEQVGRLGALARRPRITIQVLPFTRTH